MNNLSPLESVVRVNGQEVVALLDSRSGVTPGTDLAATRQSATPGLSVVGQLDIDPLVTQLILQAPVTVCPSYPDVNYIGIYHRMDIADIMHLKNLPNIYSLRVM